MSPFCDGAALVDLRSYARSLSVSGSDARDYLQRMLSADLRRLDAGRGLPATLMTPKGKLIAAFDVHFDPSREGAFLLSTDPASFESLVASLERLVILEEVELEPDPAWRPFCSIQGGGAEAILSSTLPQLELPQDSLAESERDGVLLVRRARSRAGGWDLWASSPERAQEIHDRLVENGAIVVDEEMAEAARIDGGPPRYGVDVDDTRMPPEAGYDAAISYEKGCYTGQEVVARIRTYGHVNWLLRRVRWSGESLAIRDAELTNDEGKVVGRITSCAWAPDGSGPVALAYVRHEVAEPGSKLRLSTSEGLADVELEALGNGP